MFHLYVTQPFLSFVQFKVTGLYPQWLLTHSEFEPMQLSHKWSSKIILIIDKITIEEDFKAVGTEKWPWKREWKFTNYEYLRKAFGSFGFCVYGCCLKFQMLKIVLNSDMALNNSVESVIQSWMNSVLVEDYIYDF